MSIIDLKKTHENKLVYCNLNNKIIIECSNLGKIQIFDNGKDDDVYDNNFTYFICDKVKIITIYDIYKNIISKPIQINLFKYPIKIDDILENPIKNDLYFFKTFLRAYMEYNNLGDMKYNMDDIGYLNSVLYDNVEFKSLSYNKKFSIRDRKVKCKYIFYDNRYCIIHYKKLMYYYELYNYEKRIIYYQDITFSYNIYNNFITIKKSSKLYIPSYFNLVIHFYRENLQIYKLEIHNNTKIYENERNSNNEIIMLKTYHKFNVIEEYITDNENPPFSKTLNEFCIESINHYNENINNYIKIIKSLFKKEKVIRHKLLLNLNLEMINYK